jgi:DNA polymerase III delta prime subunit
MGRKSSIKRLAPAERQLLERLLREDRLTLDEMLAEVRRRFPASKAPSRSALHRYKASLEEMLGRMREIDLAARVVVTELGENANETAGALLAQAITTLATNAALRAHDDELTVKEIAQLARAARNAIEARKVNLQERQAIEGAARERLVRAQQQQLDAAAKTGRFDPETLKKIREEVYGIRS